MCKKTISLFLAVIFLLTPITACNAAESKVYSLGDVTGDGVINEYDYLLVSRHYFGTYKLSDDEFAAADVDQNEVVDQYDYLLICRHYFGTYKIVPKTEEEPPEEEIPDLIEVPNIVSQGKTYTITPAPASQYDDTYNSELTDGVSDKSASYLADLFCGLNANTTITVDLEDDGKQLSKFEVSYLCISEAGVNAPSNIIVYVSEDGVAWTSLGGMELAEYEDATVKRASLELSDDVSARYVRFDVFKKAAWVFVDEVIVYSSIPKYVENILGKIENVYRDTGLTDKKIQENISKVASGKVYDDSIGFSLVSEGCDYTVDCDVFDARSENRTDKRLTNANTTGSPFERDVWLGMKSLDKSTVTVDLGKVREDISAFSAFAFNRESAAINLPWYIDVSVSTDNKTFYTVGRCYGAETEFENHEYRLTLSKCVKAQYVRFTISAGEGYVWLEEVSVYANANIPKVLNSMYGAFDFETTTIPSYWSQGNDYNATVNLISGKPQQIVSDSFLEFSNVYNGNTLEDSKLLTDGKVTNNNYCYNGSWFHFTAGGGRSIYYDFGHISSVSSFSVRYLDYGDWSIALPEVMKLALSENGKDWYLAASVVPQSNGTQFLTSTVNLDKSYRARYAMIYMEVGAHVFLDEITIYGKKNVSGASALTTLKKYNPNRGDYEDYQLGYAAPSDDLLGGVKDICLIYHNGTTTNESFFKPYVSYVDENGKVLDTMFDGYLFLPTTGSLPSGGKPHGTNIASDWDSLYNLLFTKGRDFDALNKTAESTKKSLGLSELKLKVYVAIPHMDDTLADFGDIDGDGKSENLTTLDGRVYVAKTYAERVIKKFNSMGYDNLELCGFYWFHETISGGDAQTSKAVNAMFDELGYQLFWIPYYNAGGYSQWADFGFDVCCYQPNYAFSLTVDESRLEYAANAAKTYGMCIEIEIDGTAIYDSRFTQKYFDYLKKGQECGYMTGAIHMYYQALDAFGIASRSDEAIVRLIYDYTYQFIKGTLDSTPEPGNSASYSTKVNKAYRGTLTVDSDVVTKYKLYTSSEHGSVTITEDGKFVYYPNKDFKGTDSFTFVISHGLGWSEERTIAIEVK